MASQQTDYLDRTHIPCPYCGIEFSFNSESFRSMTTSFEFPFGRDIRSSRNETNPVHINHYCCPSCRRVSTIAVLSKDKIVIPIMPASLAKSFPPYIPENILEDYNEAFAILHLSPKASAMLSRRCLETIIKDFWGVDKYKLSRAIDILKDDIPEELANVLESFRIIGNAAAHFKLDSFGIPINVHYADAHNLLLLIELLFNEWYIARHKRASLYEAINNSTVKDQQK